MLVPWVVLFHFSLETVILLKIRKYLIENNSSDSNQVLKDMQVLSCDREELTISLQDLQFEWFIKSDTRSAITTNYFVIVSVPFKLRKLVMATAYF